MAPVKRDDLAKRVSDSDVNGGQGATSDGDVVHGVRRMLFKEHASIHSGYWHTANNAAGAVRSDCTHAS